MNECNIPAVFLLYPIFNNSLFTFLLDENTELGKFYKITQCYICPFVHDSVNKHTVLRIRIILIWIRIRGSGSGKTGSGSDSGSGSDLNRRKLRLFFLIKNMILKSKL